MPRDTLRPHPQSAAPHAEEPDVQAPRAKRLALPEPSPCAPVAGVKHRSWHNSSPERTLLPAHFAANRIVSILLAEACERGLGQADFARRVNVGTSQVHRWCSPDAPDPITVRDCVVAGPSGSAFLRSVVSHMAEEAPPSTLAPEQHGWHLSELLGTLAGATRKALLDGQWDKDEYREQDEIAADMEAELARFRAELRRRMGGR